MNNEQKPHYRPFPNGTSFLCWHESNCGKCWKGKVSELTQRSRCPIENAMGIAIISNGKIPQRIAKRLKWDGKTYLTADCIERQEKRPYQPARRKKTAQEQIELL